MAPFTPLLRPDRYFAERRPNGRQVVLIAIVLALTGLLTVYGIGWALAANIDGTVMVDNPARPSDGFCENAPASMDHSGCDRPREVERNIDRIIWSATGEFYGPMFLAFPLGMLLTGAVLHVGVRLAGGDHGVGTTLAVAAWGALPTVVSSALIVAAIYVSLDPVTVTPASVPEQTFDPVLAQLRAVEPVSTVLSVVTAIWSAVIWRFGLEHGQGLTRETAWLVAGLVAGGIALLSLT